ncbi:WD40 repeat-like protein [Dacryopinax primogenitus]|uniref:WD40 repeat-like protein n=1 Tax=Dacryopinax primogenitus (strain DJM 731) TaxID=1858805 RepID=M5GA14_DACPD|nr:WD40 repeat-like protein [Dacryopinax primogenitus]EJU05165.1 WD40 repeat-like protein [Dacryopinax primogenitus]
MSTPAHQPEQTSFTAPEGVYSLTDDFKPPVLHTQIVNSPNLYPSMLTTVTVNFQGKVQAQRFAAILRRQDKDKQDEAHHDGESDVSSEGEEGDAPADPDIPPPTPGIFSPSPDPFQGKRKPPRATHNIRSTSSSFVTRIHTAEGLTKHLSSKSGEVTFVFYTGGKSFFWCELGGQQKEPLARVTFAAFPTCSDVNRSTSGSEALDLVIGFNTGDLMWFDPLSSRYVRINKGGCMTTSPVTCVRWVPGHRSMFLASHADGTILVYDKEREDGAVVPGAGVLESGWNALEQMIVLPTQQEREREKDKLRNPVSYWRICRRAITDFSFSPDLRYISTTSEDGCLRILDPSTPTLLSTFSSYFGSLTCCAWTGDSKYVITGGQDDLLSVFSISRSLSSGGGAGAGGGLELELVARCQGHGSFVASVAVDMARCRQGEYRFASVGEDKQVVFWDYAPFGSGGGGGGGAGGGGGMEAGMGGRGRRETLRGSGAGAAGAGGERESKYHPAPARAVVPVIYPTMAIPLQGDLLSSLAFSPLYLLTVTRPGWVKSWARPMEREREKMSDQKRELLARGGEEGRG